MITVQVKPFLLSHISTNGVELYFFETLKEAGIKAQEIFANEDFYWTIESVIFTDLNDGTAFVLSGNSEREGLV